MRGTSLSPLKEPAQDTSLPLASPRSLLGSSLGRPPHRSLGRAIASPFPHSQPLQWLPPELPQATVTTGRCRLRSFPPGRCTPPSFLSDQTGSLQPLPHFTPLPSKRKMVCLLFLHSRSFLIGTNLLKRMVLTFAEIWEAPQCVLSDKRSLSKLRGHSILKVKENREGLLQGSFRERTASVPRKPSARVLQPSGRYQVQHRGLRPPAGCAHTRPETKGVEMKLTQVPL